MALQRLQNVPTEILETPDADRARRDRLCAETRGEWNRKEALALVLFACIVVLAALGLVWRLRDG